MRARSSRERWQSQARQAGKKHGGRCSGTGTEAQGSPRLTCHIHATHAGPEQLARLHALLSERPIQQLVLDRARQKDGGGVGAQQGCHVGTHGPTGGGLSNLQRGATAIREIDEHLNGASRCSWGDAAEEAASGGSQPAAAAARKQSSAGCGQL